MDSTNRANARLSISPTISLAKSKKRRVRTKYRYKKKKRKKIRKVFPAKPPLPLTQYLIPMREFQIMTYKNLVKRALGYMETIQSVRGTLEKREYIYGDFLPKEIIEFKMNVKYLFLQWVWGENNSRTVYYRKEKDKGHVWLKQAKGIWKNLNFFLIDAHSKPLLSGNRHIFPMDLKRGFWFTSILEYAQRELTLGDTEQGFYVNPIKREKFKGYNCFVLNSIAPMEWVKEDKAYLPKKENEFYAREAFIWLEEKTLVPLKVIIIGKEKEKERSTGRGKRRILEIYQFKNLEFNGQIQESFPIKP